MDVMELRRRLLMQMAQSANLIHGSITLDSNQATMAINVPFQPKLFQIVLRKYPDGATSYYPVIAIGGFFDKPEGAAVNALWDGMYYVVLEATSASSRSFNPSNLSYSDGVFTLGARNYAFPWVAGTYDYIIAG